ncbi:CRISPR-associated protein (Cas_Csd1) [Thalassoglobus neptunius]|uniref:CRISPR-associated protein (Cas_Csd1) n=1 Tax=Thalassoglobus neptunius TaxID=1938619 RepID=A0A5C5WAN2_9PLAN|nr:type I-C CRISPR-associated protein Cas8c/Csd1 [Thalassoglobus neptunius]TWT47061.1 CRISPR-associated protein (Cas_Csd1) [Thalassoglobus neptunius]
MILQALNSYYERLENDSDQDVAPFGFSRQQVSFCVVLERDGTLANIEDARVEIGEKKKRLVPQSFVVCGGAKPSGSGINPRFLWDNPAYMLGYRREDNKPERTLQEFEAFRDKHLELEKQINVDEFSTVCRFLEKWEPSNASTYEKLVEVGTGFGVFRIRAEKKFIHEHTGIRNWWQSQLSSDDADQSGESGQCLVTGRSGTLARLHEPKIKGVAGGQSAGTAIVSFNLDAFESYGKSQSFNAPVSEQAAFQYCTALNHLLVDRSRRVQIGDATTVFWTEKPTQGENFLGLALGTQSAEDEDTETIRKTLDAIGKGGFPAELGDRDTPFYVLGLSPNAARASVRFWLKSTLGEMFEKLKEHHDDLEIDRSQRDALYIYPWQIIRETARESKDIPPLLSGALMRSILTGGPYPQMLLSSIIRRIRADRRVNHIRAATIKACLNRNSRFNIQNLEQEIPMSLDSDREDPPYRLGRLFAELEKTQEDALTGINDTIKDRYFGAASATPGSVFPRLIRMSQHHLGKLERGKKIYHEKRIQEICEKLDGFPPHLNLRDQGLFAIGYYHQRQDLFKKKSESEPVSTQE